MRDTCNFGKVDLRQPAPCSIPSPGGVIGGRCDRWMREVQNEAKQWHIPESWVGANYCEFLYFYSISDRITVRVASSSVVTPSPSMNPAKIQLQRLARDDFNDATTPHN